MARTKAHRIKGVLLRLLNRLIDDPNSDPKLILETTRQLHRAENLRRDERKKRLLRRERERAAAAIPEHDEETARRVLGRST